MSEPFIFIGTHAIREGKLEDFRKQWLELVEVVEAKEPRLIAFNAYVSEDGTEVTVVQVHPDADSMGFHMQVARDHISQAYQSVLETIRQLAGSGVPLSVNVNYLGGFTRALAG